MAGAAIDLITNPALIQNAKEEHRKRLVNNKYIPDTKRRPPLELARQSAEKLSRKVGDREREAQRPASQVVTRVHVLSPQRTTCSPSRLSYADILYTTDAVQ
jgi:hypothetical protein